METYTGDLEKMPVLIEIPGATLRGIIIGGMSVHYWHFTERTDFAPVLKGLPNDACHNPHWGYMIEGQMTFHYPDGTTQIVKEGQFCWLPPGHRPIAEPGTKLVDVNHIKENDEVYEHVQAVLAKM
jgi:hypothetical protein